MANTLIVYYTRSGFTRRVAERLARMLDADIEAIREKHGRTGVLGFARSLFDVARGRTPAILPCRFDPARYRAVVLGSPVWVGHVSSPVRSYIAAHPGALERAALFCTQGSSGADTALAEMSALRHPDLDPVASNAAPTLSLCDQEIDAGDESRLVQFAGRVRQLAA